MSVNQTINEMMAKSKKALDSLKSYSQEQVDALCRACCLSIRENAELLAREAIDETRLGSFEHKIIKNTAFPDNLWNALKGEKSVGVIREDKANEVIYVAQPKGVIVCVIPTTNPTITVMGNAAAAIKGRNTCIFCPHPRAKNVTKHSMDIINAAFKKLGAPDNILQCVDNISIETTQAFMKAADVIVATGGPGLVKAAYSSGKPALGVGAGNVQGIIDRDADYKLAVDQIVMGRSWDNGQLCACNQSAIMPRDKAPEIIKLFQEAGAHYVNDPTEIQKLRDTIFPDGKHNPDLVGQPAAFIAEKAGIKVSGDVKVLLVQLDDKKIGADDILCSEKMNPVISAIPYDTLDQALHICNTNLYLHGAGHTACVYSNNIENVKKLALDMPVCRILVNQDGVSAVNTFGNNGMEVTTTLGCGSWGGNSIDENLSYKHLINVTQVSSVIPGRTAPSYDEIWG
ncbi:MAG: aldehyde dehydrogenase family protein [Deltaproteobacteria bacterium]|jgi:succinate-semialdehyde dehydrogenase|nr:aldehyde dehydrogenase family protein [Deltaproteobacteria bacterium]